LYSPLGRSSRAGEHGGSHYRHTNEGKQIHSSSSKQEELATFQDRIKAIANQLGPADATFIEGVFSCMGSKGGDVVQHSMGEAAAASKQAEEAETREAELEAQINRNPRGGRQTRHRDLLLRRSGCPVFCLRQAAAAKKTGKRTAQKTKKAFYIYRPALKPQPPRGFALWLRRPSGPIEIRGVGGERATWTCFCVARAVLFFCLRQAAAAKNQKTGKRAAQKKKKLYTTLYMCMCRH
jgi:hypothetical protein